MARKIIKPVERVTVAEVSYIDTGDRWLAEFEPYAICKDGSISYRTFPIMDGHIRRAKEARAAFVAEGLLQG
jgi:hypothetical protein